MSFVLLVCIACTPDEYQQKIIFLEIVEAEKVFMDAFKQVDVIKLANLYANYKWKNAVQNRPAFVVIKGRNRN